MLEGRDQNHRLRCLCHPLPLPQAWGKREDLRLDARSTAPEVTLVRWCVVVWKHYLRLRIGCHSTVHFWHHRPGRACVSLLGEAVTEALRRAWRAAVGEVLEDSLVASEERKGTVALFSSPSPFKGFLEGSRG